jgi:hypothetical protein
MQRRSITSDICAESPDAKVLFAAADQFCITERPVPRLKILEGVSMLTASVAPSSHHTGVQPYFQQRNTDLSQLGSALQSGDLKSAQQDYNAIVALGQNGPFAKGVPFANTQREQDFTAIGKALQSGDLATAKQAFIQLENSFRNHTRSIHLQPVSAQPVAPATVHHLGESRLVDLVA